jgi:hypothetical protein
VVEVGIKGSLSTRGSQLKRISYTCPRIDSGIPNQNQESLKMTPESKNDSRKLFTEIVFNYLNEKDEEKDRRQNL